MSGAREFRGTARYRLVRWIGEGSHGSVYEVVDTHRGANIALKVIFAPLAQPRADFERAFNDGDAIAAAQLYAVDSDRIGSDGEKVVGRELIRQRYAAMMQRRASAPASKPFHADIDVRFLRPDVAMLDGSWRGTRAGRPVRGFFTLTATKQNGRWSFAAGRDRGVVEQ